MEEYKKLEEATEFLKSQGIDSPGIGIVLGTGLGQLTELIEIEKTINYSEIPNFPLSTVEFHSGKLHYGTLGEKKFLQCKVGFTYTKVILPVK